MTDSLIPKSVNLDIASLLADLNERLRDAADLTPLAAASSVEFILLQELDGSYTW